MAVVSCTITGQGATAVAAPATVPDAFVYAPIDGGRAVVRWDGQAAGYTLPKATALLPGHFDGQGGGLFLYRAGAGYDGVLRIRIVDGKLTLSLRPESIDGSYEPLVGDFDGNGIDDILWAPDGFHGPAGYLWLFRSDGSHTSHPFDTASSPNYLRQVTVADVNLDGISDLYWPYDGDLWIMKADLTHTARRLTVGQDTGWYGYVNGDIGPDDGHTRRRLITVYEGDLLKLTTFNSVGQSTSKELSPHVGNCCAYQQGYLGHFRAGSTASLFRYGSHQPELTESMADVTAGGNLVRHAEPQIGGSYDVSVADLDGNGYDDLLLTNRNGTARLVSSDGTTFTSSALPNIARRSRVFAVSVEPPST